LLFLISLLSGEGGEYVFKFSSCQAEEVARCDCVNFGSELQAALLEAISLTRMGSPSNMTTIDRAFSNAYAAVIVFSGDDIARIGKRYLEPYDESYEREPTRQARPNVIFEAGMAFGRFPERTVVVSFGKTRPLTDIAGLNILYLSNSPESRNKLAGRLRNVGCQVNTTTRNDWLKSGDYGAAIHDDPDHQDNEKIFGLVIVRRRASADENATYKPKVWVELTNSNQFCVEVRHLGWEPLSNGIEIKAAFHSMQLKLGKLWSPKDSGVDILYVPPDGRIQAWIQPSEKHTFEDLLSRCEQEGRVGILKLRVDGREVKIPV
jgi:Predicted nucleotide-binding protein containing TIR-like domain